MKVNKVSLYIIFLIIISAVILTSCSSQTATYEIPVFDIMEEKFTTLEVKTQDVNDWEKIKLSIQTTGGARYSFSYSEYEQCTLFVTEKGTVVKKGDVLGVITDRDLEYDLRLKQEDLELKQLLYTDLYNRYLKTGEGYYEMQLALLDVEQSQYNYNKAAEKMETLKFKSSIDGTIENVSQTYKQMTDEFNNKYKVYTITFTYAIDNYIMDISIGDAEFDSFEKLGLKPGDVLQVYDSNNKTYKVMIYTMRYSTAERTYLSRPIRYATVTVRFVKEEGVDYTNIIKYALYYDLTLTQLEDVIVIPKNLVTKTSAGLYYTYVLYNNKKTIRYLTLGTEVLNSTSYVVLSGLHENDLIITDSTME